MLVGVAGVAETGARFILPLLFIGIVLMVSLGDEHVLVTRLRLDVLIKVALVMDVWLFWLLGCAALLVGRFLAAFFVLVDAVLGAVDMWVTVLVVASLVSVVIGVCDEVLVGLLMLTSWIFGAFWFWFWCVLLALDLDSLCSFGSLLMLDDFVVLVVDGTHLIVAISLHIVFWFSIFVLVTCLFGSLSAFAGWILAYTLVTGVVQLAAMFSSD